MRFISLFLVVAVCGYPARPETGLTVDVRRGEGMAVRAGEAAPGRIVVVVLGAAGRPVANATVTFVLPRDGVTGAFASGLSMESVMTGTDGAASVGGIVWGGVPGVALIRVKASRGSEIGEAVVTVEVRPGDGKVRTGPGRQGGKKWVLAAAAAGAVLVGVALAGGKGGPGGSIITTQPAASTAPTLGTPSISIGRP